MVAKLRPTYASLDALRGLACLVVVVFHWRHFFNNDARETLEGFPLSWALSPIYYNGSLAVDLFFCISGFVFFANYFEKIRANSITSWNFFSLRASRLLPLHVSAVAATYVAQQIYIDFHGIYFESQHNSLSDLVQQVCLIHFWLPGGEVSVNLPTWSLSIELLVYLLFYFWARQASRLHNDWTIFATIVTAAIALILVKQWHNPLGRGMSSFFMGGAAWLMIEKTEYRKATRNAALWGVFAACCFAFYLYHSGRLPFSEYIPKKIISGFSFYAAFPMLVALAAAYDRQLAPHLGPLRAMGDSSYAVYIIHFPIQVVIACAIDDIRFFSSPVSLTAFSILVFWLGNIFFNRFERPAQKFLRARLITK